MIRCPFCHFENEEGALFCEQCKSDLGAMASEPPPAMPLSAEPISEGTPSPVGETLPLQGEPTDPFAGGEHWSSEPIPVAGVEPAEPVLLSDQPPPAIPEGGEVGGPPPALEPVEDVASPQAEAIPLEEPSQAAAPPAASPEPAQPPPAPPAMELPPAETPPGAAPAEEMPAAAAPSAPEPAGSPAPAAAAPPAQEVPDGEALPQLPAGAQPRLLVLRGLKRNMEYPLYEGLNFLGRADEKPVDIDLEEQEPPDRIWCSRQHACINWEGDALSIEDLGSANGTFVNRSRIYPGQKRPLAVNDVIQIGTVQLKVLS